MCTADLTQGLCSIACIGICFFNLSPPDYNFHKKSSCFSCDIISPEDLCTEPRAREPNESYMNVKGCVFYLYNHMQFPKSQQSLLIPNSMAVYRERYSIGLFWYCWHSRCIPLPLASPEKEHAKVTLHSMVLCYGRDTTCQRYKVILGLNT